MDINKIKQNYYINYVCRWCGKEVLEKELKLHLDMCEPQ